jgi:hypothetical protein
MNAYAEVERQMAAMSDAELIDVLHLHAADYEELALQIARGELARRRLPAADLERLREHAETQGREAGERRMMWKVVAFAVALIAGLVRGC